MRYKSHFQFFGIMSAPLFHNNTEIENIPLNLQKSVANFKESHNISYYRPIYSVAIVYCTLFMHDLNISIISMLTKVLVLQN